MAFPDMIWIESATSGGETVDRNDGEAVIEGVVLNVTSPLALRDFVKSKTPDTYHQLMRQPMTFDNQTSGIWKARVKYGKTQNHVEMVLDMMCDKFKRMRSIRTLQKMRVLDVTNPAVQPRDFRRLIGVTKDRVEGVETYIAGSGKLELKYTLRWDSMPADYLEDCEELQACVNNQALFLEYRKPGSSRGQRLFYDRGELLFVGYNYQDASNEGCVMTFRFDIRRNEDNISVGERSGFLPGAETLLADTTLSAVATSLNVVNGNLFPTTNFVIAIGDEQILVGTRTDDLFSSLTRAYNGTAAAVHAYGDVVVWDGPAAPAGSPYRYISKEGHQYGWETLAKRPFLFNGIAQGQIEVPTEFYVEQVYHYGDFDILQIFDVFNNRETQIATQDDTEEDAEEDLFEGLWGGGFIGGS